MRYGASLSHPYLPDLEKKAEVKYGLKEIAGPKAAEKPAKKKEEKKDEPSK
jgi:hypothetical protein